MRLMECVRLRVKDLDFEYRQIAVRDAKGAHDRYTLLPASLLEPLHDHLIQVKRTHGCTPAQTYVPTGFFSPGSHLTP
jgi:integrase